jgi:hypothetical protein
MSINKNLIITVAFVVVIIVAAAVYFYTSLPQGSDNDQNNTNNGTEDIIFSVLIDNMTYEYNTSQLSNIELFKGSGSFVKVGLLPDQIIIDGPNNFTGISILTLLENIDDVPANYSITFNAKDGYLSTFTKDEVNGLVDIYNKEGNITGIGNVTMVLAYLQNDEYLEDLYRPFRIVFIGDDLITGSNLWARMITSMQINELP